MACITSEGTLTAMARRVLETLAEPRTAEHVAASTDVALFRIRASLRELEAAGLLAANDGRYHLTAAGRAKLAQTP